MTFQQRFYWCLLKLAFFFRLRKGFNHLQRWIKKEHLAKRSELPKFLTPRGVEVYIRKKFDWREDRVKIGKLVLPLDWITDPEVFQNRIENYHKEDGDCDDYHFWVATALSSVVGVSDIYLLSSGFKGGGHATCVYRYKGKWWHFDYRIREISDPHDAPMEVAKRYTKKGKPVKVTFVAWASMKDPWGAVAIGPNEKIF